MAVIILIKVIFLQHSLSVITFNTQYILALFFSLYRTFFFSPLNYSLLESQDEFSELTLNFDIKCSQNFNMVLLSPCTCYLSPWTLVNTKCCNGLKEVMYLKQVAQNIDTLSNLVYSQIITNIVPKIQYILSMYLLFSNGSDQVQIKR